MRVSIQSVLLLALPAIMMAQYTGGEGRGDVSVARLSSALPVELTVFTASTEKHGISLHWSTASETNNYGFDVERNATGLWEKVGFVPGCGTTNTPQSYIYTDHSAAAKAGYRLKQIDRDGSFEYSKVIEAVAAGAPAVFSLSQNYPNPFNPSTTISFTVPSNGPAALAIVNTLGQVVTTLFNGEARGGFFYRVQFNASGLASGIYFSRLEHNGNVQLKKLQFIK